MGKGLQAVQTFQKKRKNEKVIMAQYIDKSTLIEELNKRIMDAPIDCLGHQRVWAYNDVKDILDTIEVKEVDLEKHLKEDIEDVFFDLDGVAVKGATHYLTVEDVKDLAKHFFELGLKAQKGGITYDKYPQTEKANQA